MSVQLDFVILTADEVTVLQRFQLNSSIDKSVNTIMQEVSARCDGNIIRMTCEGQILDGDRSIISNGIKENSQIRVITDAESTMLNIYAKYASASANDKPVKIRCSPNIKSEELIAIIKNRISFNTGDACYTYNRQNLKGGKTLAEQKFEDNCTVIINVQMNGG